MKCPKCNGEMEEGHVGSSVFGTTPQWYKTNRHLKIGAPKIKAYSCLKCGFIESYTER